MVDVNEAEALAQHLLAAELPRRWRHSAGVAGRADRLGAVMAVDQELLVAAAWLHDIGYADRLRDTGFHPIDGARHLRGLGADERVVNLVAHHSCARVEASLRGVDGVLVREFPRDVSLPHDELCFCDQTTGPDGEHLDATERLAEIRTRYPNGHVVRRFVDLAEGELVATVRRVEASYSLQPR
jgi:putative nucleotidyltransferase with HDIG domain